MTKTNKTQQAKGRQADADCNSANHLCASQRSSSMGSGGWSTARFTVEAEDVGAATAKNCATDELVSATRAQHLARKRGANLLQPEANQRPWSPS
jgi:squalene cyclase